MPFLPESRSRRAWRREIAAYLVDRVDREGVARFVGTTQQARREMLKVAGLLPSDILAELYEDPRFPGRTYLELRHAPSHVQGDPGFRVIYPEDEGYREAGEEAVG
jgi:hypothetical protein